MKQIFGALIIAGILSSCGEDNKYSTEFGSANFINASPSLTGATPRPGVFVYLDTLQKSASTVAYRGSSGYISAIPGNRNLELRSSIDRVTKLYSSATEPFEFNKAATYIIYDTNTVANPLVKVVKLTDDFSALPAAGTLKYRFLNLAVLSTPLDVTFLRTSVTPNDSVTITNRAYIGGTPTASALSPFSGTLPLGSYSVKMKLAGTQTPAVASTPVNASFSAVYGAFYTIYATGTAAGQPLSAAVLRNY